MLGKLLFNLTLVMGFGIIVWGTSALRPAVAQNAVAPGYQKDMAPPGPYEAKLDALWAAHDADGLNHAALSDVADADTALRALNWLRAREIAHGGGTQIALLYSASLWRGAKSLSGDEQATFKASAAAQFILARYLVSTEGFQCADVSAPGGRLGAINNALREVAQFVAALPEADRQPLFRDAVTLMMLSFKSRENDIWLCQGGADYFVKYFQKHPDQGAQQPAQATPGVKNVILPPDLTILPDFVPYDSWRDKRHAAIDTIFDSIKQDHPKDYLDKEHRMQ